MSFLRKTMYTYRVFNYHYLDFSSAFHTETKLKTLNHNNTFLWALKFKTRNVCTAFKSNFNACR